MSTSNKSSSKESFKSSVVNKQKESDKKIWEYVPFEKFSLPSLPATSSAADLWSSFRRIISMENKEEEIFPDREKDLYALPSRLEKFVLPQIEFEQRAAALDSALDFWLETPDNNNSVVFVVGQPYSNNGEFIKMWGETHNAEVIEPPDYDEILSGSEALPGNFPEPGKIWVLPNLEKFFLRHANGLKKVRKFLEIASTGQLGKGVVGCQSFAWSYLQMIFRISQKNVFTLQSFDGAKFAKLLGKSVQSTNYTRFKFLNMLNGKKITGISSEDEPPDPFFSDLAAFCRGNIVLEVNMWKEKLRLENDNPELEEKAKSEKSEEKSTNETVVWLDPELSEFVLPSQLDDDLVIILHTLMLHHGLPEYILYKILPFSESRCRGGLSYLLSTGIVKNSEGKCFVAETAVIGVRRMLFGRDYLVDKL